MNESLLIWGLVLLAVSALLLVLEVLLPSGGVIAVASGVVGISGLVCLFRYDTTWGLVGTLGVLIVGPMLGAFMLKIWPETPMGRRLIHGTRSEEDILAAAAAEEQERAARLALVGLEGVTVTDLRPVGMAKIGERRLEVLSEAGWIRAGTAVKVVSVSGNEIKVRQA